MSGRYANQEQRNRSHIFDSEPEQPEASRHHKKMGYAVKDEIGDMMKQQHHDAKRAEDYKAPQREFKPRAPDTPETKHVSRRQYLPTPVKKGEEHKDKELSQDYVAGNQRLFNSKAMPFAVSDAPDKPRQVRVGEKENGAAQAQTMGQPARSSKRDSTMGSLLRWDT